ncbi:MAG TPA: hypothetical protein VEG62_04205 [Acidimicrobiales bacterium]|nr:hypothetical protein [Acidimicrobiales bacterium]
MTDGSPIALARALLGGLADLGPVQPLSGDLSLELALSLWLRQSGASVLEARDVLIELRRVALDVGGLDHGREPIPLLGRSPRADVLTLATCLADLLRRVAAVTGRGVPAVVVQVLAAFPAPAAEALGA